MCAAAYCDVISHLSCHSWVVRESQRYGAKWTKRWAQENAIKRILAELPGILASHAHPVDERLFPTWEEFRDEFLNQGGIIEGVPPSESTTALTVDVLIEPDGAINILSSGDQICSAPFEVWGVSVPQSSVPADQLAKAVRGVASSCRARGIIGHFSVDFVTFIDPHSVRMILLLLIIIKIIIIIIINNKNNYYYYQVLHYPTIPILPTLPP